MDDARIVLVLNKEERWEDQTENVATCMDDPASGLVKISYKINPAHEYLYRRERVRTLAATATLNPAEVQLRIGGRLLSGVDTIIRLQGFYLVKARGARALYEEFDVREERDVAADPSCRAALGYFRAVAELVSVKNEEGQSLLAGQYKYLSRVPDASVLAAYLMPGSPLVETETPGPLIYPFGTNASQKAAVEKAFRSQVTIVQGPPRHRQDPDHSEHGGQRDSLRPDGRRGVEQQRRHHERRRQTEGTRPRISVGQFGPAGQQDGLH